MLIGLSQIISHFSLERRVSRKLFPILFINASFCPLYSHIFFYFSHNCQKSCNFTVMTSMLSGYDRISSFIYNILCPRQIFFTFSPLENIFSTSESNSKIQLLCVPDIPFEFLSRISVNLFADFHQGILYRRIYFSQPLKEADTHINTVKITVFPHL